MQRQELVLSWLVRLFPGQEPQIAPVGADASFRRYFRAQLTDGRHYIVMDAPPQHEDCRPFVHVAQLFAAAGVRVPKIIHQDLTQGFLLLDDFGDTTYLARLDQNNAAGLYGAATDALLRLQQASQPGSLPEYDRELLLRELQLFPDWYVSRHLGIDISPHERSLLEQVFARLLDNNLTQPKVWVHRDFHSRNLMVIDNGPGILDFQDAVYGPLTYDLVSLLRDAYIRWDEEQVLDWTIRYWERARRAGLPVDRDFAVFYRDFEWMGLQRHLKVLGIFARLHYRDGKSGYLDDMPLVLDYVRATAGRYPELAPVNHLLDRWHGTVPREQYSF